MRRDLAFLQLRSLLLKDPERLPYRSSKNRQPER
ncbi:MAG: hypothetical protein QOJ51_5187, partial [Acidobacteriaceae bacterium]|nr:hypothetical protein [Acidobacteriaceae bacterium]